MSLSTSFPMQLVLVSVICFLWLLYIVFRAKKHTQVFAEGKLSHIVSSAAHRVYIPPLTTCLNGTIHTILSNYKDRLKIDYSRHVVYFDDGGTATLDFINPEGYDNTDILNTLFIIPGLTGSSRESYITSFVSCMIKKGWRCLVMNSRGIGGRPLTSAASVYHATDREDIDVCVRVVCDKLFVGSPLYGVGYSMGAVMMANYGACAGTSTRLKAVLLFGCPFDLQTAYDKIQSKYLTRNVLYVPLVERMRNYAKKNRKILEQSDKHLDLDGVANGNGAQDLERFVICPIHGYANVEEYYRAARVRPNLGHAAVPMIFINALDDPFTDQGSYATRDDVIANNNVVQINTAYGGHLAWINSLWHPFSSPSFADELGCEILVEIAK